MVCSVGNEAHEGKSAGCTPSGPGTGACKEAAEHSLSEEEPVPSTPASDDASEAAVEKKRRIREFQCNIMRQVAPAPATDKPCMHASK